MVFNSVTTPSTSTSVPVYSEYKQTDWLQTFSYSEPIPQSGAENYKSIRRLTAG